MSLLTLVIAAASAWSGWQQRRRDFGELMALDDRLLADIGLRRTDVPAIFHERVRREGVEYITSKPRLRPSRAAAKLASTLSTFREISIDSTLTRSSSNGGKYGFDPRRY